MGALGFRSSKVGGEKRYFNLALVGAKTLRLAVDNAKAPRRALGDMRAAGGDRTGPHLTASRAPRPSRDRIG